jgi:tryptophan synthase alpha chain
MTRIGKLFEQKKQGIVSVYCTAGYPLLDSTREVMQALQDGGADMMELGMPYSDPLADGPVIQASSSRSLANGMGLPTLFKQLKGFRDQIRMPVILMGYLNPILQYGMERFCRDAADSGVDGLILPDLPIFEYETMYGSLIRAQGLDFIFLVTPETPDDRIRKLDSLSNGFLYAVSSSSTTGREKDMSAQASYFERLRALCLKNPVLVGFGIRDRDSARQAQAGSNGIIIGTAFVQALGQDGDIRELTQRFLKPFIS